MTPASWTGVKLIRGYQLFISPLLGHNCRFHPTCSQYAIDALTMHGFFKGSYYALIRLFKCAPWHPGGYDPVPPVPEDSGLNRTRTVI
ncbi:MAG: membrane protein insertion efficiency factor YidD [Synergistaceae bacterium]|nr:membrane protein insertion efficiency factor YidD [Synergistota bacterium]NLM70441.1 membrane protein insertion efficiency factor YidD [Synergistaceae bacterium]